MASDQPVIADIALNTAQSRISQWAQIKINLFWFANNFHWIALISVVIPAQVAVYFGNAHKASNLPLIIVGGTLVAFIVNPLTGSLSDYVRFRLGRRRPFMIVGTVFNVLVLLTFALLGQTFLTTPLSVPSIGSMALLFLLLQLSNNFANAPWSAIIADQVPSAQRGAASGWYGVMTLLGTIGGFLFAGTVVHYGANITVDAAFRATFAHEIFIFYVALAAVQTVFVLLTVLTVNETLPEQVYHFTWGEFLKRFRLETRKYPDFTWVLLTRVMVLSGIWGVNNFLLYYFNDVLHRANATGDLVVFSGIYLSTSLITTFLGGAFSDRLGRKPLVYLSGAMMTITCLLFIFYQTYTGALIAGTFFGLGFGAYTSVDWALATDVLPPTDQYGKDMGIWSAAGIIPQVIGVALGGGTISALNALIGNVRAGYSVLFGIVVVLFGMGTFLVSRVKSAR